MNFNAKSVEKILCIYGAGGFGREVLELAKNINSIQRRWSKFVFIVDGAKEDIVNGVEVYSYGEILKLHHKQSNFEVVVSIGEPSVRKILIDKLLKDKISIASLVHPSVYIPPSTFIGRGVIIQYGCFVSCNVVINDYVCIQPHSNISHDVVLHEGCMISGFCNIAGRVEIGKFTYLGISSCYKEKIKIGDFSVIGMGAVVCKDIPSNVVAYGSPARVIRDNDERKVFK